MNAKNIKKKCLTPNSSDNYVICRHSFIIYIIINRKFILYIWDLK